MKKVLLTGGAGFIGSAVCRYLVKEKDVSVLNVDTLTYAGNTESLKEIAGSSLYQFANADICDREKMAALFEKGRSTITEHLKNIFSDGELNENSVCRDFRHTADDGKTYNTQYYNLRAVTAVGYRVNSERATEFRKWATEILHEYIIKGFAMDDERLKQMEHFGEDYFDEMLFPLG